MRDVHVRIEEDELEIIAGVMKEDEKKVNKRFRSRAEFIRTAIYHETAKYKMEKHMREIRESEEKHKGDKNDGEN
jgi:Arc/MetJ-type ribon-helix-helix transcriptional regulator